ncbi:unnamed protein product, partial [marine sediment metagenome]
DWRRMNGVEVHAAGPGDVRLRFPMSVRHTSWRKEITSETSPFSMQEHEQGLPLTYARRSWGLLLDRPALNYTKRSGPFYQARLLYGQIGLDRYKDFVLDWPDRKVAYPRVFMDAGTMATRRKALAGSALPETFSKALAGRSYMFSGDDAVAARQLKAVERRLRWMSNFPFISPTISHHGTGANYTIAAAAEDVLAWPKLPPDKRREIRARLALITYCYEEPDVVTYGGGSHTGNPNMGTARFMSALTFLELVPDHPMHDKWIKHMAAYMEYKVATQIAPGGGYFEPGAAYHMHGYARSTNAMMGLVASRSPNADRLYRHYHKPDWDYYMNLLTPADSRYRSRMIPGLGNGSPGNTGFFLDAAGTFARRD